MGWLPEDLLGKRFGDFLHPDDTADIPRGWSDDSAAEAFNFEARFRCADGSYRWISCHVRPVTDDNGVVTDRVAGWRDIHEQRLTSEQLATSEDLFRTAMDNSAIGMSLVGPDGAFLRINRALSEILGRSPEVLLRSTWQELTHPDDLDADLALVAAVLSGERDSYRLTKRYLRPDGDVVWCDLSVACVRGPDGGVSHFISQISDTTATHREIVARQEAERRFRLLASHASDVVFMANRDRIFTWVSPSVVDALGWTPEELVGTTPKALVHPDDLATAEPSIQALYSPEPGPGSYDFKIRWRTRDGDYRWLVGSGTRVLDEGGELDYVVSGLRDITDEVLAREYLASVQDAAIDPHMMFAPIYDDAGNIVDLECADVNPAAAEYLRVDRDAIMGHTLLELYGGAASRITLGWCAEALRSNQAVVLDNQIMVSEVTNATAWFDVRAIPVNGQVSITWRDITARHDATQAVAASEEKFRLLAENATDAVLHARDGVMVWLSPSLMDVLGWAPEEWMGHGLAEFTHPDDISIMENQDLEMSPDESLVTRLRLRHRSGDFHWVEVHASTFENQEGAEDGIVASFRTIDDQVRAESVLKHRARFDDLTGLLNRAEIFDRLRGLMHQTPRTGQEVAVAFCDLDDFKEINDTFGHQMGDYVLRTTAGHLRSLLRSDALIARLGGDEVLLVLPGVQDLQSAYAIAEKVRQHCAEVHHYHDIAYQPKMSIGVTLVHEGEELDAVIARADRAMYRAKSAGGNQVVTAS